MAVLFVLRAVVDVERLYSGGEISANGTEILAAFGLGNYFLGVWVFFYHLIPHSRCDFIRNIRFTRRWHKIRVVLPCGCLAVAVITRAPNLPSEPFLKAMKALGKAGIGPIAENGTVNEESPSVWDARVKFFPFDTFQVSPNRPGSFNEGF